MDTINSANPPPEANTIPANPTILNAPTPATTGPSPHIKKEGDVTLEAKSGVVPGTTPTTQPQQQVVQPYSPYGAMGGMGGYGGYGGYGNMYGGMGGMGGMMPGMYGAMGPMGPNMMQIGAQRIGYFSQLFQMASQSLAMTIGSFAQFAMAFGQIGSLTGGSLAGLSLAGSLRILWEKLIAAYRHYMWIERYPKKSAPSSPSSSSHSGPPAGKGPDWLMISILTLAVVWLFKRLWRWLTKKPPTLPAPPPPGPQAPVAGAQPQPGMMPMMGGYGGYGMGGMGGYGGYGMGGMGGYGGYRPY